GDRYFYPRLKGIPMSEEGRLGSEPEGDSADRGGPDDSQRTGPGNHPTEPARASLGIGSTARPRVAASRSIPRAFRSPRPQMQHFPFVSGLLALCGVILFAACPAHRLKARIPVTEPGATHFKSYCAACHQYDGQGAGDAPPLSNSPWITGPEHR